MRLKYLCCIVYLFIGFTNQAQVSPTSCDLANLYAVSISKNPNLQQQNIQVRLAEASKQLAASTFDYRLFSDLSFSQLRQNLYDSDPRVPEVGNSIREGNFALSAGVQRTFRSGINASVGLDYTKLSDNFPIGVFNAFAADNVANLRLSVSQPLLRGRTRDIATANELIASLGVDQQLFTSDFVLAGEIYGMAVTYWQYLAAHNSASIFQENEDRVRQVLEVTEELVRAERKPNSDLIQIQADLKDKERQTITAFQQAYNNQQDLGRVIGLTQSESISITEPKSDFPVLSEGIENRSGLQRLIQIANENRTDLKALRKGLELTQVSLKLAENDMKPQLDLSAFVVYGGNTIGDGLAQSFNTLTQREGRNYQGGLGLSYVFPVNNNLAQANLLSTQLQYSSQRIQIENQIRNIELNVSIAYNNYLNSIKALRKSAQALEYYEQVFDNEQVKFQSGLTTLLNLILFQERLTFAQLEYIQNQQQFAIAISTLRFETGTLTVPKEGSPLSIIQFYSLPE